MSHINTTGMDKSLQAGGYVASISTAIGGFFSLNNIALMLGIISTILLTVIQYRRNSLGRKMDEEYHKARMKALKQGHHPSLTIDEK